MSELKIVCCVKQTFATDARIHLDADGQIAEERVSHVVNPYDEFAVEEALRIKERLGADVAILSVGGKRADQAIRQCLAMGADRGLRIDDQGLPDRDEAATAAILAAALREMNCDLILCGKTSVDSNAAEVPARLAEALGLAQISAVSKLEVAEGRARGWSEGDGLTTVVEAALPVLATAEKSLNMPRYPTLPNILRAKKKPIGVMTLADLGLSPDDKSLRPTRKRVAVRLPPERPGARLIPGKPREAAVELARILRPMAH